MSDGLNYQALPLFEPWGTVISSSLSRVATEASSLSCGALMEADESDSWYQDLELDLITKAWRAKQESWPLHRILAVIVGEVVIDFHKHLHIGHSDATGVICRAEVRVAARLARSLAFSIEEGGYWHILPGSFQSSDASWHAILQSLLEGVCAEEQLIPQLSSLFAASLSPFTNGRSLRRRPLPLKANSPILQVNHPRSDESVGDVEFRGRRILAEAIADRYEGRGYCCEATGRYAPFPPDQLPKDEEATLGGLLRASGAVFLTHNARAGTGLAVGLLASVGCPQLLLSPIGIDPACRFGGETYGYSEKAYEPMASVDDICELCDQWVSANAARIQARHQQLMRWENEAIDDIALAVVAASELMFDSPDLTKRRALFWTSNPIYWHQCPTRIAESILEIVGIETREDATSSTDFRSAKTLMTYSMTVGLQAGEMLALWDEWHRRSSVRLVGSHKDYAVSLQQWEALDREFKGGR